MWGTHRRHRCKTQPVAVLPALAFALPTSQCATDRVWRFGFAAVPVVLALALQACAPAQECLPETPALRHMDEEPVSFTLPDGRHRQVQAWIADEPAERQAGFQYLCPQTITERPMWFEFGRPVRVGFHMHNVHAALDIAFIGVDGRIAEIRRMDTETTGGPGRTYFPAGAIRAALEAEAGWFAARGITPGTGAQRMGVRAGP